MTGAAATGQVLRKEDLHETLNDAMGPNEVVAARAETTRKAVSRELSDDEVADYVSP